MLSPIRHRACSMCNIPVPAKNFISYLLVGIHTIIVGSKDSQIWHGRFQCADRWSITFAIYSMTNGANIIKNYVATVSVSIYGDVYSEAVIVSFMIEDKAPMVSSLEFGRP